MMSFKEWLLEADPEFVEGLNLGRAAKWAAKKAIPLAVQGYMAITDPVSSQMANDPRPAAQTAVMPNADEFIGNRESQKARQNLQSGKAHRAVRPGGKPNSTPIGP
jgi:hypothetical protein